MLECGGSIINHAGFSQAEKIIVGPRRATLVFFFTLFLIHQTRFQDGSFLVFCLISGVWKVIYCLVLSVRLRLESERAVMAAGGHVGVVRDRNQEPTKTTGSH